MSHSIFIVGSLLLMTVAFSLGSPYSRGDYSQAPPAVSVNEQCRQRNPGFYTGACQVSDPATRCEALMCSSRRGDIPGGEDSGPARDGTWCGPGKVCFNGTCTGNSPLTVDPFHAEFDRFCEFME